MLVLSCCPIVSSCSGMRATLSRFMPAVSPRFIRNLLVRVILVIVHGITVAIVSNVVPLRLS
jgi:hypothetical protein